MQQGVRQIVLASTAAALWIGPGANASESISESETNTIEYSPLDNARIVGLADQPELIVPMDVPGWARDIGIVGVERVYKGICGPDGAVISIRDLYSVAERDIIRIQRGPQGSITEVIGESPAFALTYDSTDLVLSTLYLPSIRRAAEYVDTTLDNRVEIGASIATGTFSGDTIGSAGSARFSIPWSVYVEGLRTQSIRDDNRFANELPDSSLNVLYDGSASSTAESFIRVTAAQLRAIFGDNVVPQDEAVSITLNSASPWNFLGCDIDPASGQQNLIDVAVHEFTHTLGFTSAIRDGGDNPNNDIQGLDVARFRIVNIPNNNDQFGTNPRLGEQFTGEFHFYQSTPTGNSILLESGDSNQPSHLNFVSNPANKLGVMDPVLSSGTTRCPDFYSAADLQPLNDMGWRPIGANALADCNGNGQADLFDILLGASQDFDNDFIPDECESFSPAISDPSTSGGVTRTVYETPGLTDLTQFNPDGQNTTLIASSIVADMDDSLSFANSNTRVVDYEFAMFVQSRDEYAFRLAHPSNMFLLIDDIIIGNSERSGVLQRGSSISNISSQSFMQLEAGWHTVHVQVLVESSSAAVRLMRESRSIGGWQDIPSNHLKSLNFTDCDSNGIHDLVDHDFDLNTITDLGIVSDGVASVFITTTGSNYDTEIAVWDSSGTLIIENDDISGGVLHSGVAVSLTPGDYLVAITGFNTVFGDGPSVERVSECPAGGNFVLNIDNNELLTGGLPSGRFIMLGFTVEGAPDCDGDGIPDSLELDCNNDGIPDDCQVPTTVEAIDVGVVGSSDELITISTCGSSFDTELALWDDFGALLDFNDDFCSVQSTIELILQPGIYYTAIAGFDTVFADSFEINVNANGSCSASGDLEIQIGTLVDNGDLESGQVFLVRFEVEEPPAGCSPADLNQDGVLNFFDVSAFLSAFAAQDPIADFSNDGVFNFFDVSAFLSAFAAGCP